MASPTAVGGGKERREGGEGEKEGGRRRQGRKTAKTNRNVDAKKGAAF